MKRAAIGASIARVLVMATSLLIAVAAPAHRGHSTLSVVEIDAGTGSVTVTHDFAAHDAEPALAVIAPGAQPSLDDPRAVAALVAYVGRRFMLADAGGRRVALTLASTRLAGDGVRLVYSGRLPPPASAVTVDSGLFDEINPDQENQVNIRRAKVTRTALFRAGTEAVTIRFD